MNKIFKSKHKLSCSGEVLVQVHDADGNEVENTGWQKNLMLYAALENELSFISSSCQLKEHNTASPKANSEALVGNFNQTGTTVTAPGGVDFQDGTFRTGDNLLFSGGKRGTITSIDSTSEVTVYQDQSITNETAIVFRSGITSSTYTSEETQRTNFTLSSQSNTFNTSGVADRIMQGTSAQVTVASTIHVVYISSYARIVLAVPVALQPGNTITVTYRYTRTMDTASQFVEPNPPITGWPLQWAITSVSADGVDLTVTTSEEHYYEIGDSLLIANVAPQLKPATNFSSDGVDWTVTAANHGFSVSDNITIQDTANYDGDYVVSVVVDANTFEIVNAANHVTETSGNVRFVTPASYFNGIHTVSSVPDANTIKLTSALSASTPSSGGGFISVENGQSTVNLWGNWHSEAAIGAIWLYADATIVAPSFPTYSETSLNISSTFTQINSSSNSRSGATRANGFVEFAEFITPTEQANHFPRIKQMVFYFASRNCALAWTFDHIQSKPNTHDMTLRVEVRYEQDLID